MLFIDTMKNMRQNSELLKNTTAVVQWQVSSQSLPQTASQHFNWRGYILIRFIPVVLITSSHGHRGYNNVVAENFVMLCIHPSAELEYCTTALRSKTIRTTTATVSCEDHHKSPYTARS